MDIDTGKIYQDTDEQDSEELKQNLENLENLEKLKDSLIEINPDDMTKEEKENKQVDLKSNTKLAGHARHFRNMRRFIENKNKRRKK
jgi:Na+/phosphate symporter